MPRRKAHLLTGRAGIRTLTWHGQPAFYRVTGYRNSQGRWVQRNPRTGHWYYQGGAKSPARAPSPAALRRSDQLNIELDVGDGKVHYFSVPGSKIPA